MSKKKQQPSAKPLVVSEEVEKALRLLSLENAALRNAFGVLYTDLGTREGVPGKVVRHRFTYFKNFLDETGTVPEVYEYPELRKMSEESWNTENALWQKQLGTSDICIKRLSQCKKCNLMVGTILPASVDAFTCPNCGELIKW